MNLQRAVVPAVITAALVLSAAVASAGVGLLDADSAASAGEAPVVLPEGSAQPGRVGAEASALALATALGGVPRGVSEDGVDQPCQLDRLQVSWSEPVGAYERGAFVRPVGPAPTASTKSANGVVLCSGSRFAYLGFRAAWNGERWSVQAVPELDAHEGDGQGFAIGSQPPVGVSLEADPGNPWEGRWSSEIEPLSLYEPQTACDPTAKPGVHAFQAMINRAYPFSGNYGIVRECHIGGRSEHKEGRAWDWGVAVTNQAQRQAAEDVIAWLLATDEHGNEYAMARRLGVMYVIWNQHIWTSYGANEGWRPYRGASAHTDHVHLSFNRAGAAGVTSFWRVPINEQLLGAFSGPAQLLPAGTGIGFTLSSLAGPGPSMGEPAQNPNSQPAPESQPAPAEGGQPQDGTQTGGNGGGGGGGGGGNPSDEPPAEGPVPELPIDPLLPLPPVVEPELPPLPLPPGVVLGPDGLPLLGPDGLPIIDPNLIPVPTTIPPFGF